MLHLVATENPYEPPNAAPEQTNRQRSSFSWWTHSLTYGVTVPGSRDECYQRLLQHYHRLGMSILESQRPGSLTYVRGSLLVSCFAIGPETWCRHTVTVRLSDDDGGVQIKWSVDLKLCGFSVGKNAIVEEIKKLAANL